MCHVLIIEGEPLIAMSIEDIVLADGANTVEIVVTGEEAISAAAAYRPDLLTSDVRLLVGNGRAAVAVILRA